jgi:Protein of unknown function (DUF3750)
LIHGVWSARYDAGVRGRTAIAAMACTCAWAASACVIAQRPVAVPGGTDAAIVLASTAMPEPIAEVGRHAWFAVREPGATGWQRIEYGGFGSGPLDGLSDVRVHAVWTGEVAARAIPCLRDHAAAARPDPYVMVPGPNSNTFVDRLLRGCDLHADLPATAVGKDFRGIAGVSWTSGGTGFQIETPLVGVRLGLTEGIEVHLLTLAFGIDLWPPAIILPLGPGRLGFDDR